MTSTFNTVPNACNLLNITSRVQPSFKGQSLKSQTHLNKAADPIVFSKYLTSNSKSYLTIKGNFIYTILSSSK